jgi:hypothetical protein
MTGICAACLHTNQSRSYLNHLVFKRHEDDQVTVEICSSTIICMCIEMKLIVLTVIKKCGVK